jgi:uncharacterized protein
MKIRIEQIPLEGLRLQEMLEPATLDLDTDMVKFRQPIRIQADVQKVSNDVLVDVGFTTNVSLVCSRCLEEFNMELHKDFSLNYPVNKTDRTIDLTPDVRQEIVLDYPISPKCRNDCKGLCPTCGKNLNEEKCGCSA